VPPDVYPELWLVGFLLDRTIRSAADLLHESQYIRCKAAQFAQIRATDDDCKIRRRACRDSQSSRCRLSGRQDRRPLMTRAA